MFGFSDTVRHNLVTVTLVQCPSTVTVRPVISYIVSSTMYGSESRPLIPVTVMARKKGNKILILNT